MAKIRYCRVDLTLFHNFMLFGRNIISPTDFRSALISPLLWEGFCVGQIFLLRFRQIFRFSFREIFPIIDFPRRPLLLLRTDTRLTLFGIRTNWKYSFWVQIYICLFWIVLSGLSQFFPLKEKTIFWNFDFFCSFLRKPRAQVEASTTTPGPARCLLIAQLNCLIFYLDNIQILKKTQSRAIC